jgi:hypothetical protein
LQWPESHLSMLDASATDDESDNAAGPNQGLESGTPTVSVPGDGESRR